MHATLLIYQVILLFVYYSTVSTEDTNLDSERNDQDSISKRHGGYVSSRTITCSSWSYKFRICNVPISHGSIHRMWVKKKHSRSPCRIGSSYGYAGRQVWVNHGCRATFGLKIRHFPVRRLDQIIKCSSWRYRFAKCFVPRGVIKKIRVIHRISNSPCKFRRSYGIWRRHYVWVSRGCRAFFHITKLGW